MPRFAELDEHLHSRFAPPERPRRSTRLHWDPVAQRLVVPDRPPTRKQINYVRGLSERLGVAYAQPETRREAQSAIDKLLRAERRARRRARKAAR